MPKEDSRFLYFWCSCDVKLSQMFRTWFKHTEISRLIFPLSPSGCYNFTKDQKTEEKSEGGGQRGCQPATHRLYSFSSAIVVAEDTIHDLMLLHNIIKLCVLPLF